MAESKYTGYFQAMLWTCTSCGFLHEGGQPHMECPACEAYKTAFVDLAQHIEAQVREEFPDLPPNHRNCRKLRLELMADNDVYENRRVAGRVLPTEAGNNIDPSEQDSA